MLSNGVISGNALKLNITTTDKLPAYLTIDNENVFASTVLDKDKTKINSLELKNITNNREKVTKRS